MRVRPEYGQLQTRGELQRRLTSTEQSRLFDAVGM
jgi:hypothetical protein